MSLLWTQLVWRQSSADWETEDGLACGGESGSGWSDVGQVEPWDQAMDRLWGACGSTGRWQRAVSMETLNRIGGRMGGSHLRGEIQA